MIDFVKSIPKHDLVRKNPVHDIFYGQIKSHPKNNYLGTVYKICTLFMFCCANTVLLWKLLKMVVRKSKIVGPEITVVTWPRKM